MADPRIACPRPRPGWRCTRVNGHEGPCAAVPDRSDAAPTPPARRCGTPGCSCDPETPDVPDLLDAPPAPLVYPDDDRPGRVAPAPDLDTLAREMASIEFDDHGGRLVPSFRPYLDRAVAPLAAELAATREQLGAAIARAEYTKARLRGALEGRSCGICLGPPHAGEACPLLTAQEDLRQLRAAVDRVLLHERKPGDDGFEWSLVALAGVRDPKGDNPILHVLSPEEATAAREAIERGLRTGAVTPSPVLERALALLEGRTDG